MSNRKKAVKVPEGLKHLAFQVEARTEKALRSRDNPCGWAKYIQLTYKGKVIAEFETNDHVH